MDNFFHLPLDGKVEIRHLSGGTDYEQCYQNAAHQARCLFGKDEPITITRRRELNLEIAVSAESMSFNKPVDLCTVECPALFIFQSILWSAYSIEPLSERFAFLIKARIRADLAQICRAVELLEAKREWLQEYGLRPKPEPPLPEIPHSF